MFVLAELHSCGNIQFTMGILLRYAEIVADSNISIEFRNIIIEK